MLPLGFIFRKYYLPLKWNSDGLDALLAWLTDVKAWLSLNFLNFNEEKTEMFVFKPSDSLTAPNSNLGGLSSRVKQHVKNGWSYYPSSTVFTLAACAYRVDFKIVLIVYKSLHCLTPSYISELLIEHNVTRSVRSSNQKL